MHSLSETKSTEMPACPVVFAYWGRIDYPDAMHLMTKAQAQRQSGEIGDTVFYLEHPPVITYGRATPPAHLSRTAHSIPVIGVPRGGQATYHGPGQLVGYSIVKLGARAGQRGGDVGDYLRAVENGLISYLAAEWQIHASAREGFTGVWVNDHNGFRKIASIGISVRRGVTAHGFALNMSTDLSAFDAIVPCGNFEDSMTSVQREIELSGDTPYLCVSEALARRVHRHLGKSLSEAGWGNH